MLTLDVTAINQKSLQSGELVLLNNWDYEKDKIVGVMLDEELRKIFIVTSAIGGTFVLIAAYLMSLASSFGRRHTAAR